MRVLIACEESQTVCKAFRDRGHEAYSADIQEPSGGHPEWHILGDVLPLINGKCEFQTMDGVIHKIDGKWDLLIAHPPCTYLTVSGNRWFDIEKYGDKAQKRIKDRQAAIDFFMRFATADCDKICIENPIGVMSTHYRKPDQIIQPYQFGHPYTKQTCLWLKNLSKLAPTDILQKPKEGWKNQSFTPDGRYGGFNFSFGDPKTKSKTFPGIAAAFADQWSDPGIFSVFDDQLFLL